MESPNKRPRLSPREEGDGEADFVPFNFDQSNGPAAQYGYNNAACPPPPGQNGLSQAPLSAPRGPKTNFHHRDVRSDPRHAKDRPKSKHSLPGHEPWILVRTKYGRRFVHNTQTKESFWRFPTELVDAVREFKKLELEGKEKVENAKWAEEQLREMRKPANSIKSKSGGRSEDVDGERSRRRRSESLQREDEEAMMAEIAREAEEKELQDAEEAVKKVEKTEQKRVVYEGGYDSDGSYEEVEVTDSEGEEDQDRAEEVKQPVQAIEQGLAPAEEQDDGQVEFGEDDIAWQLAAMEQNEASDYENEAYADDEIMDDGQDDVVDEEEAISSFRQMLTDHNISPFTPWENLLSNEDLLYDDRWTSLPTTRARKAAWEAWVRDAAAQRAEERKRKERENPTIPYLQFLAEKASPKLYWVEYRRKYKKEAVMNERRMNDKEREKLYRDFVARLKLPESRRKADLETLLSSLPLRELNKDTHPEALPEKVLGHVHFWSLPHGVRMEVVEKHIAKLPPAPTGEIEIGEITGNSGKKISAEERAAQALREREKKVAEERRRLEKEARWARREAEEREREVRDATLLGARDRA